MATTKADPKTTTPAELTNDDLVTLAKQIHPDVKEQTVNKAGDVHGTNSRGQLVVTTRDAIEARYRAAGE